MATSRLYLRFLRPFSTAAVVCPTTASSGAVTVSKAKSKLRKVHNPDKDSVSDNNASSRLFSPSAASIMKMLEERDQMYNPRSVVSFNASLAHYLNCGLYDRVIELFDEIPQRCRNITPDEDSYKMLIKSYCRSGSVEKAMKTFEEMDQFGVPRSVVSFNALLDACLHSGLSERVPQLFDEMPQRYHDITPDKYSYGMLIESHCDNGSVEKAMETMRDMEAKGVEVTMSAFDTILGTLYVNGQIDVVDNLWNEIESKGCEFETVTVSNFRRAYARRESSKRARESELIRKVCQCILQQVRSSTSS